MSLFKRKVLRDGSAAYRKGGPHCNSVRKSRHPRIVDERRMKLRLIPRKGFRRSAEKVVRKRGRRGTTDVDEGTAMHGMGEWNHEIRWVAYIGSWRNLGGEQKERRMKIRKVNGSFPSSTSSRSIRTTALVFFFFKSCKSFLFSFTFHFIHWRSFTY